MATPPSLRTCPVCRREIPAANERADFRPFCSTRCKSADLGSWLNGSYRISRPLAEEDLDAGVPGADQVAAGGDDPGDEH